MMSSLDGRLDVGSWAPEGQALYKGTTTEYQRIHKQFEADAWLAGTNTMKEFTGDIAATRQAPRDNGSRGTPARPFHLANEEARYFAIAIDRKGKLHWAESTADEGHLVVILGASVPDEHLAELRSTGISYLVMQGDDIDLAAMLEQLGSRLPIRKLLLEGGAKMNGAFLKAGLVDEISLLLCPAIDGKTGASTIYEAGESGAGHPELSIIAATPGPFDTCHLRYRVGAFR
jgi:riboflavin biosynthesis pyrimidine reductase